MCTERALPIVRRSYRALQGFVTLRPYQPKECVSRLYNRLNEDYHPMHALCRFFLEHSGPSHQVGNRTMLPFLLNMERLYELFVAEWLNAHLPSELSLKMQERVEIDQKHNLHFDIDLVIYNARTGDSCYVLDTKYKISPTPLSSDIAQVIAYAQTKNCHDAVLIYPVRLGNPIDTWSRDIHIRSLVFSLDGDLEQAGQNFLSELLQS
jgi:5-methylcytosine-specific restriction enzyme subunit McrC